MSSMEPGPIKQTERRSEFGITKVVKPKIQTGNSGKKRKLKINQQIN